MSSNLMPTSRTRIVREPDRGVYDRDAINLILDEAFLCHVGFVGDDHPFVVATSYGPDRDHPYHSWLGRESHVAQPQPRHPSVRNRHATRWTCACAFGL